jgi:hypothetical protein
MAQVKGTLINAWRNFLKERYGEEKVASAIQSLNAGDRDYLQSPVLDSSWYPMELQDVMGRLTKTVVPPSDKDIATELGRYTAEYVHTKVYRTLLSGKSKNALDWFDDLLYQGLRKCVVERISPTSSVTRYHYLNGKPKRGQCRTVNGYLVRQQELSGWKNVKSVHQKCMLDGDDCCEYLLEWES